MKKGSLSWGCPPAGLRGLSGVFPLPFLRRRAVVLPLPLLPVSASSSFILEEASPSKSLRRVSTRDPPGGVSWRSLASASSIAAAVAAAARASASSRARAASASRACSSCAFCASNAASSASVLAFSSATFRRAASMASFLAASSWALAVASAWALSSASFFALPWASASSSAFTSASLPGNGLLRQAGFLVGCRQLTVDPGGRCPMGGCGRESGRNGRHGLGVDGHAMRPLRSLLLGDAGGALHGSAVLPGPLPGNPTVAGHPTGALTGARHVPFGSDAAAGAGLVGRHPPAVGRLHVAAGACWGLPGPQEQRTGLALGLLGDLDVVAKGGGAGVVSTIGPLGTGGWGSALGALGGFGSQGLLVLPPPPVPLLVPGGPLLRRRRRAAAALQPALAPRFRELLLDQVPHGDVDRGAPTGRRWGPRPPQSRRAAALHRACPAGSTSSSACGGSGTRTLPPAATPPLPAGGPPPCPPGARSSRACRLRTRDCCSGTAGPTAVRSAGAPHGGGAAATSYPLLANSPWQRGRCWS